MYFLYLFSLFQLWLPADLARVEDSDALWGQNSGHTLGTELDVGRIVIKAMCTEKQIEHEVNMIISIYTLSFYVQSFNVCRFCTHYFISLLTFNALRYM